MNTTSDPDRTHEEKTSSTPCGKSSLGTAGEGPDMTKDSRRQTTRVKSLGSEVCERPKSKKRGNIK